MPLQQFAILPELEVLCLQGTAWQGDSIVSNCRISFTDDHSGSICVNHNQYILTITRKHVVSESCKWQCPSTASSQGSLKHHDRPKV